MDNFLEFHARRGQALKDIIVSLSFFSEPQAIIKLKNLWLLRRQLHDKFLLEICERRGSRYVDNHIDVLTAYYWGGDADRVRTLGEVENRLYTFAFQYGHRLTNEQKALLHS